VYSKQDKEMLPEVLIEVSFLPPFFDRVNGLGDKKPLS
jgi:hypothetical protein